MSPFDVVLPHQYCPGHDGSIAFGYVIVIDVTCNLMPILPAAGRKRWPLHATCMYGRVLTSPAGGAAAVPPRLLQHLTALRILQLLQRDYAVQA